MIVIKKLCGIFSLFFFNPQAALKVLTLREKKILGHNVGGFSTDGLACVAALIRTEFLGCPAYITAT